MDTGHFFLVLFILVQCSGCTSGEGGCTDVAGIWYNQLGSEMILNHTEDGLLTGEYRTAVERKPGSAGSTHSGVIGAAPYGRPGSTFGFSVSWRNGASTTAWTAQCVICDGDEVLLTTWLLRSTVDTCIDKWKSTYIGQDHFTRYEQRIGPRKRFGTHTPQGYQPDDQTQRMVKRDTSSVEKRLRFRRQASDSRKQCSLDGTTWYNLIGSKVTLTEGNNNIISGKYHTLREAGTGRLSGLHSDVHGIGNADSEKHTFAMFVVWQEGASVTGWAGQCHICVDENNRTEEVLEMAWLHRSQIDRCEGNWRSTQYGQNTFYTIKQVDLDALKLDADLVGEFGEVLSGTTVIKVHGHILSLMMIALMVLYLG